MADIEKDVIVEEDARIGANVTILCGVTIGRGSIIGAGSVIRKTLPPILLLLEIQQELLSSYSVLKT